MYLELGHTAARHSKLAVMRMPNDFGCSVATHFIKKIKHFEKKNWDKINALRKKIEVHYEGTNVYQHFFYYYRDTYIISFKKR